MHVLSAQVQGAKSVLTNSSRACNPSPTHIESCKPSEPSPQSFQQRADRFMQAFEPEATRAFPRTCLGARHSLSLRLHDGILICGFDAGPRVEWQHHQPLVLQRVLLSLDGKCRWKKGCCDFCELGNVWAQQVAGAKQGHT